MTNTVSDTVSDEYLDACIQVESGGNPRIKASTSSALGLGQFLNATWLGVVRKHAPEIIYNMTESQILAMRLDPSFSIRMLARFTEDNQKIVGMNCTDGDLYLAHFLGAGAAQKVFRAPPTAKAVLYTGAAAAKANPTVIKANTTCAQLRAWASKRMAQSGGHGWVKKYYRPAPSVGVMSPIVMHDQDESLPVGFRGNLDLYHTQIQLTTMKYYTGELDGLWGGKTSEAVSGFINDRGGFMPAPTSAEQWYNVRDKIKVAIDKAEAETPPFTRPVKKSRAEKDPAMIAKIAPEVVPTKQNFFTSGLAAIGGFFLTVWQLLGSYISSAWDFFTSNKDSIPSSLTDPSFLTTWLGKVPPGVWLFAGTLFLVFIAYNARKSMVKITDDVSTGVR